MLSLLEAVAIADREPLLTQLQVEKVEVPAAVQHSPLLTQLEILRAGTATAAAAERHLRRGQAGQRRLQGEERGLTGLSQSVTAS